MRGRSKGFIALVFLPGALVAIYNRIMANLTLVYGMRLLPADEIVEPPTCDGQPLEQRDEKADRAVAWTRDSQIRRQIVSRLMLEAGVSCAHFPPRNV